MQVWMAIEVNWNNEPSVISIHRTEEGANKAIKDRDDHVWVNGPFTVED